MKEQAAAHAPLQVPVKGGAVVLTRLIGSDAQIDFSDDMLHLIERSEAVFPGPEWVVIFNDSDDEDEPDELVFCRRFGGVLMPVAYVDLDEVDQMEHEDTDWLAELMGQLSRTEAEIEALEADDEADAN